MREDYIPPQGLEYSWRGIMPPQGVKGIAVAIPIIPPTPPEEEPEPAVQTVASSITDDWTGSPRKGLVKIGGYYYFFYRKTADGKIYYKSSKWGISWSGEVVVSSASTSGADEFCVFEDGTYIWVVYATGTPDGANQNAITIRTRRGSASGGVISFGNETTVRNCGCCIQFSMAKSTNRIYLAGRIYNTGTARYYIYVWYSTDGSSWTEILASTTMVETGYGCAVGAVYDPANTDGLMIVTGKRTFNYYTYKRYDGNNWGNDTNFAEKTSNSYMNRGFCLVREGNNIHFIYLPIETGGYLRHRRFASNAWGNSGELEASGALSPSLSQNNSVLYCFYIVGSDIVYKTMNYTTLAWDANRTTLQATETSPARVSSDRYPEAGSIGVGWRTGASSPYNLRFKAVKLP